jgi:hypothetical protein
MTTSLEEIEELRSLRNNIRRGVNALEVCWSCGVVCEGAPLKISPRQQVWLCRRCQQERNERSSAALAKALHAAAHYKEGAAGGLLRPDRFDFR